MKDSKVMAMKVAILFIILLTIVCGGCARPAYMPTPTPAPTPSPEPTLEPSQTPQLGNVSVYFFDVGQGDSALVMSDDSTVLIDGSTTGEGDLVVAYLGVLGVDHLDAAVLTHAHEDHAGGLIKVLSTIPCDNYYDPGYAFSSRTYEYLLGVVDSKDIKYHASSSSEPIVAGDLSFEVLSPRYDHDEDVNDNSVVLRLVWGDVSFLFQGDASSVVEDEIMDTYDIGGFQDLESTVLKVSHHGSKTATSDWWLDAVRPEVCVISVGADNRYGHPAPATMERIRAHGATVYETMNNGTVLCESDGNTYYITTMT